MDLNEMKMARKRERLVPLDIHKSFLNSLMQVFSFEYLEKMGKNIKKNIVIKEKDFKNPDKAAYTEGRTIYVNQPVFERMGEKEKTNLILHEFIHIMQNTRNFFILKAFKEVFELGSVLYKIIRKNLKGDLGEFLTGRKQRISNPRLEIISYLMNGEINWQMMDRKGREEFVEALVSSGIFNMETKFWRERLF